MENGNGVSVHILGVSGSPQNGATKFSVQEALKAAEEIGGVTTDFIDLRGMKINFCIHCNRCVQGWGTLLSLLQWQRRYDAGAVSKNDCR